MKTWTVRLKITDQKSKPKKSINEPKYKYDHSLIGSYEEETDKIYCCENGDLFGVVCSVYLIKFGEKEMEGYMVPSVESPMFVCNGRTFSCYHSLYKTCHDKIQCM